MRYTKDEIIQYVSEEDVKFIRLAFCDVFGVQKNIAIMPEELPRAFEYGIAIDASAIRGFGDVVNSDLLLHPDPDTLAELAWNFIFSNWMILTTELMNHMTMQVIWISLPRTEVRISGERYA